MPPRIPSRSVIPLCNAKPTISSIHSTRHQSSTAHTTTPPPSHWLSSTKARIGKCILFGLSSSQASKASQILSALGNDWRALVAGREGFLTSSKRAGLLRHRVVWGEMDSMGHVNNVMYTRYAESARVEWVGNVAAHVDAGNAVRWRELMTPRGEEGLILRSIRTDYKFPMKWPDHISVFHKLREIPSPESPSFILDVIIMSELHQRPAARCVEDIVVYDYQKAKAIPVPSFMMNVFKQVWEEQEEAKKKSLQQIKELDESVRELEIETWDRVDAVEDMGGKK